MALVQVIALGGVGEIGKNCTVVQQGDDIVVIDCGLAFPNEEMLGVDIVIPDFTYLVQNKEKIRGVFITHAHEDHVGSLPYLLKQINVPIYATEFAHALIRNKLEEKLDIKSLDLRTFKPGDIMKAGSLSVEPIRITHSLLSDSTNVERPGWGPSERTVKDGLRKIVSAAPGRVMLTTFASNIHRMQQFYDVAAECGRKVVIVGRRMEQNLELCARMNYVKIPKGTQIPLSDIKMYPDDKLCILTTGSQGEPMSALVQMSKGEYGRLQVKQGDTLIYSARPIPGNEAAIWRTVNRLFRMGCDVVYESSTPIHVSGHAYREELKMMINLTRPFYLAPVHGEPRHQHLYLDIARDMGYPEHRIFTMTDGVPLCLDDNSAHLGEQVPYGRVLVDNSGTPGIPDDVLRDRYNVANDGLIAIAIVIDPEVGEVVGDPIIQARGFHGPPGLLDTALDVLNDALRGLSREDLKDIGRIRHETADVLKRFIQKKAQLRPLILPTIVEI